MSLPPAQAASTTVAYEWHQSLLSFLLSSRRCRRRMPAQCFEPRDPNRGGRMRIVERGMQRIWRKGRRVVFVQLDERLRQRRRRCLLRREDVRREYVTPRKPHRKGT